MLITKSFAKIAAGPVRASPVQEVLLGSPTAREKLDGVFPQQKLRSHRTSSVGPNKLERLPSFSEVPIDNRDKLLQSKLTQCFHRVDFDDPQCTDEDRELKVETLKEIVDYLSSATAFLSLESYATLFKMFAINCFRDLPHSSASSQEEDEYEFADPNWAHLELIYESLLQFLEKPNINLETVETHCTKTFLSPLMNLFNSEDPRERDMAKQILHKIYNRFPKLRDKMNQMMNHIFFRFIFETGEFNGISELLEIRSKFLGTFTKPTPAEHLFFFKKILVPLHKPSSVASYHQHLMNCTSHYVSLDESLFAVVIGSGILKFWPIMLPAKQVLFLNEVEHLMGVVSSKSLDALAKPLFKCLCECLTSLQYQVAEKAFTFFNNNSFLKMYKRNVSIALPLLFPSLHAAKFHWHQKTRSNCTAAFKYLMASDPESYKLFLGVYCQRRREKDEEPKPTRKRVHDFMKTRKLTISKEQLRRNSVTSGEETTSS